MDWIYPPRCVGCGKPGTRLCSSCLAGIIIISPPFCEICGIPISRGRMCETCRRMPPKITAIRSWAVYGGVVRKALHELKYSRNVALGDTFSPYLCDLLQETGWKIDVVVPIPLGDARRKERGYNQAALLAKPIAQRMDIDYRTNIVLRKRETLSQVNLSFSERKINVSGAFEASENSVRGKNVLVIDDITTSGSTLDSCAEALFKVGAKDVYGMTVAHAG